MLFERLSAARSAPVSDAGALSFAELVAMRPPYLRGPFAPGRRGPGGERPGRGQAPGLDFDGVGPYMPGDDVRRIDWRATARTGTVYTKRFAAQSHRACLIVADLHGELCFGTEDRPMLKTAALMVARLAWTAAMLHEPAGLILPSKGLVLAPQRGYRHVLRLLAEVQRAYDAADQQARSDLEPAMMVAAEASQAGDQIAVVSDFAGDLAPFLQATRPLGEARALSAYIVQDAIQTKPPPAGRYPSRMAERPRHVFALGRTPGQDREAEAGQRALRQAFLEAGWQPLWADEQLPKRED